MELSQAIALIRDKNISRAQKTIWADVGCGSGLFTNALAHLLTSGSKIYAIDQNAEALKKLQSTMDIAIEKIQADFLQDEMALHDLDGILMANSLHFVKDKISFINKISSALKSPGYFLIVEYDMDRKNPWVPFPISFHSLQQLFLSMGFSSIHKIHELPSRYHRANIYSAMITK